MGESGTEVGSTGDMSEGNGDGKLDGCPQGE